VLGKGNGLKGDVLKAILRFYVKDRLQITSRSRGEGKKIWLQLNLRNFEVIRGTRKSCIFCVT